MEPWKTMQEAREEEEEDLEEEEEKKARAEARAEAEEARVFAMTALAIIKRPETE